MWFLWGFRQGSWRSQDISKNPRDSLDLWMILIFKLFLEILIGKTEKIRLYNMNRKRSFGAYLSLIFVKMLASLPNTKYFFQEFFIKLLLEILLGKFLISISKIHPKYLFFISIGIDSILCFLSKNWIEWGGRPEGARRHKARSCRFWTLFSPSKMGYSKVFKISQLKGWRENFPQSTAATHATTQGPTQLVSDFWLVFSQ